MDLDEFGEIAALFAPLTGGAPEALGLLDDAAVVAPPPGYELVVTTDTLVEGVHFLPETPPGLVARRLLRTNLSDLAAKAAQPWGWFLSIAWPPSYDAAARAAFARGLAEDQARYGLALWGGDTVRTPGPLTASATLIGRAPAGAMVKRSSARAGDVLLVSGTIGDAGLGLDLLQSRSSPRRRGPRVEPRAPAPDVETDARAWVPASAGMTGEEAWLIERHQLPEPRLALREALRAHATAAADVSDGLLADAGRIARASGFCVELELARTPLSPPASAWLERQADRASALIRLATSGDDYEVVCTSAPGDAPALIATAQAAGVAMTVVGRVVPGAGVAAMRDGAPVPVARLGWTHGRGEA